VIKISIHYPNEKDGYFDDVYYIERHLPLARSKIGKSMRSISVEKGISGASPESRPPYIIICSMVFDSIDEFYEAFLPHANELRKDFPNYTNLEPVVQISEIKL